MLGYARRKSLLAEAAGMPSFAVTSADLATVYRFADGTLSPLTGPMTEAQYNLALDEKVVISKGERYVWGIPMSLPVTNDEAAKLQVGKHAAIVGPDGNVVGVLEVKSIFAWDKQRYIEKVYGTSRTDHPGGAIIMNDERTMLVGGDVEVLPAATRTPYAHQILSPVMTRAMIADRGWQKALAFQTRNPLHRAHEYALVYGLEELTRAGWYAGVVLNPLVGELKGDDVDAATRMRTYNALKDQRLLGKGDSDTALWESVGYELNDVFELVGLDIKMHYGGPAEALMHAVYRQNHGFTHIVIGRKHADAPYKDGTAIWGDFDAQTIFDDLPGTLHTQPVRVGFAAYYDSMGRVDLMENHKDEKPFFISGTKVRDILVSGQRPDERIVRGEIADILIEAYRERTTS
jgi:sulfate adenylyltransferase